MKMDFLFKDSNIRAIKKAHSKF